MLSGEVTEEIERELAHAEDREAALLEALLIVQRHNGWVNDEQLNDVAAMVGVSRATAESLATFYSLVFREPVGRHVILICDSISCWIVGYEEMREHLFARLGIEPGDTTGDGRFTLLTVPCLGACDHAPVMMVDEDLHSDLTPARIDEILERYP